MSSHPIGLKKLQNDMQKLSEKEEIKLEELMSPVFISRCSKFDCLKSLFDASDFAVESPADFAAIPDAEWDEFIVGNTSFSSWIEMQQEAMEHYIKQSLNIN